MATIINADTSNGLKLTSDTSGIIDLQSAGTTIATVSSTGITMASGKTLPATSLTTASGSAPSFSARAWINFNGSSASIRASGNVTSLTDNGTGDFTVNFTTAMADTNYAPIYYNEGGFDVMRYQSSGTQATGSCQIRTGFINGTSLTQADLGTVCASFFS